MSVRATPIQASSARFGRRRYMTIPTEDLATVRGDEAVRRPRRPGRAITVTVTTPHLLIAWIALTKEYRYFLKKLRHARVIFQK
jgi:hypothetical protein